MLATLSALPANRIVAFDGTSAPGFAVGASYTSRTYFTIYAGLPVFSQQPSSLSVTPGATVVFSTAAVPLTAYAWQRDGVRIGLASGNPTLVLSGTAVIARSYTCVALNGAGSVTSAPIILTVAGSTNPGRLINLSILTQLSAGEKMTLGTVLGGTGTGGNKALLTRAAGPSLVQLGVTGVLPDPQMSLVASATNTTIAANDDWSGTTALSNAFTQVGAFAYASANSKDAAGAAGTVIAELYDSTPSGAVTSATPRLVNVSVLKQITAGSTLTAGFVIGGTTAKTVLVRAIGPGLAQFGVGGTMPDPKLSLFNGPVKIAENDDWGGDAQITSVGNGVGAFALPTASSKDAILLVTLAPGNYSAEVSGTGASGVALVEVYEVP